MNDLTDGVLPDLDDARVQAMEATVFGHIARERAERRARRRRWWVASGAAAAVVVLAAAIAPAVTSGLGASGGAGSEAAPVREAPSEGGGSAADSPVGGAESELAVPGAAADAGASPSREIVSSGSAGVTVGDVRTAVDRIAADAEDRGGYVESISIGSSDEAIADSSGMIVEPAPPPHGAGDGWISVRVPADQLAAAMDALDDVGEVTSSNVSAQDVTDQAVDLRARIAAAETSVARLTELMAEAASTADLLAAETALQERQAALDADRQQLALLEGQVALASLSVQLSPHTAAVVADPAGFGDGVAAGWNGLVATLNGIVIAFGFLLPWLAVILVTGAIVWGVVRLARRSPRGRGPSAEES